MAELRQRRRPAPPDAKDASASSSAKDASASRTRPKPGAVKVVAKRKSSGSLLSLLNGLVSVAMLYYGYRSMLNMFYMMNPLQHPQWSQDLIAQGDPLVHPGWSWEERGGRMSLRCYLSTRADFSGDFLRGEGEVEWRKEGSIKVWHEVVDMAGANAGRTNSRKLLVLPYEIDEDAKKSCLETTETTASSCSQKARLAGKEKAVRDYEIRTRNETQNAKETTDWSEFSVLLAFFKTLRSFVTSSSDSIAANDEAADINDVNVVPLLKSGPLWNALMTNRTIHVHVILSKDDKHHPKDVTEGQRLNRMQRENKLVAGKASMVRHMVQTVVPNKRILWKDITFLLSRCYHRLVSGTDAGRPPWQYTPQLQQLYQKALQNQKNQIKVAHWKPEVAVKIVPDSNVYPYTMATNFMALEVIQLPDRDLRYLPPLTVHEIGMTSDQFLPLNRTLTQLPLHLTFATLGTQRHRLLRQMSTIVDDPNWIGNTHMDDNDVDDFRRLVSDTNVPLLALTIAASILHLLFEYLTLSNDMKFWHDNTKLAGLSVRALYGDLLCQIVVLLFLIEQGASLLVTVPAAAGIAVAAWKVQRASGFAWVRDPKTGRRTLVARRIQRETAPGDENYDRLSNLTLEMDRRATRVIGRVVGPPILLFVIKTLAADEQVGWYSWAITSATSVVYAGGFVLMTPQLFLNYKLKSVAHLPWKVLCYRFVNTFIDDLFAFIIKMPTMTRISCFRDDVVFFIYLYQRWIYPVDKSRPTDGASD